MPSKDPQQRSEIARKAAYAMHAKHDPNETTKAARAARLAKYGQDGIKEMMRSAWEKSREVRRLRKERAAAGLPYYAPDELDAALESGELKP